MVPARRPTVDRVERYEVLQESSHRYVVSARALVPIALTRVRTLTDAFEWIANQGRKTP
jgi:hypothetical protein